MRRVIFWLASLLLLSIVLFLIVAPTIYVTEWRLPGSLGEVVSDYFTCLQATGLLVLGYGFWVGIYAAGHLIFAGRWPF